MNGIQFLALCGIAVLVALTYRWEIVLPRRARERSAQQLTEPVQVRPARRAARTDEEVFDLAQFPVPEERADVYATARWTRDLFDGRESA